MIALVSASLFLATLAVLGLAGFAITYVLDRKTRDERLTHLEQQSTLRAAVHGQMSVQKEFRK